MKDIQDIKEIKRELWEVIFKAQSLGASKAVKYAIIDAMIVIDKEAEKYIYKTDIKPNCKTTRHKISK